MFPLLASPASFPPYLAQVVPQRVVAGSPAITVALNGERFVSGAVAKWNGAGLATTFFNANQLTAVIPAANLASPGTAAVTVVNPDGGASSAITVYVDDRVSLTYFEPGFAKQGGSGFSLSVVGLGFQNGAAVLWNGSPVSTTFRGPSSLSADIPATLLTSPGPVRISVRNPDGAVSNEMYFVIYQTAPNISSISPTTGAAGGSDLTITVNGSNFTADSFGRWNGNPDPLPTQFISSSRLICTVPASLLTQAGAYTFSVGIPFPGGGVTISNLVTFTLTERLSISLLSPSTITAGSAAFSLTVSGGGFPQGAVVRWNSSSLSTAWLSTNQLRATVPAANIASDATVSISVLALDGRVSNSLSFVVSKAIPTLVGLDPPSTAAGSAGFNLTVNGSGFLPGAAVLWKGSALATTWVSSTHLAAAVPANLLGNAGSAAVAVRNPGGGESQALTFTIQVAPTPVVTSVNPASVPAGGPAFTLTVSGSSFSSGAVVQWNGNRLTTTFQSASQLTAVVPAILLISAGPAGVIVLNSGGLVSNSQTVMVTSTAALTNLSPASVPAGNFPFTLTASGKGFAPGAIVEWNGSALTTNVVNDVQLTPEIPGQLVAEAGSAVVAVRTAGTLTNTLTFTIGAPVPTTSTQGIVNSASSMPSIAPGSLISVYGFNLSSGAAAGASAFPLPTTLNRTSLTINGLSAPLLYASPTQINAQVPFEAVPGTATMVIDSNGLKSLPVEFAVSATGPGIFTVNNHILASHFPDGSLNSPDNPARPGQYVIAYLTGQGLVDNVVATGAAAPGLPLSRPLASVEVKIGGVPAEVGFIGLGPGFAGLAQMNVLIPDVPAGDQPFELSVGGKSAKSTLISIKSGT